MNTIDAIKQRRSIRSFNPKSKIPDEYIQTILACAMSAPSARNQQGWRFVIVDNEEILNTMANNLEHGKMCKTASHAIVVCYEVSNESQELYWIQDSSAATQNILLAATDLGIGSVWIAVHPRANKIEFAKKLFNLPKNIEPLSIVALGYKEDFLKELDRFDTQKIVYNKF